MDLRLKNLLYPKTYIWIDVIILKETQKAILIEFDGKKAWFPKAWIVEIKQNEAKRPRTKCPRKCRVLRARQISIKISEYHWTMKF
jgi:hypothetical protein